MSSKKRRKPGSFFRRPDQYGQRSDYHTGYSRESGKGYFICDICGSNVPSMGGGTPVCPRCMVPMQPMDGVNPNARRSGSQKQAFDYSSRIYFQTEGHPQYIGLPLGHPDPDDEDAVNRYNAKRDVNRSDRRMKPQPDFRQRNHGPFRNRHPNHPQQSRSGSDRPPYRHPGQSHNRQDRSYHSSTSEKRPDQQQPIQTQTEATPAPQPPVSSSPAPRQPEPVAVAIVQPPTPTPEPSKPAPITDPVAEKPKTRRRVTRSKEQPPISAPSGSDTAPKAPKSGKPVPKPTVRKRKTARTEPPELFPDPRA